ncbi:MAG: hypothetical protein HYV27_07290 [Candidatus Hydrogenedentes bacterium]|nr:hypothetical protein [Candidatus Hydrogenedentota bacterium]
MNGFQPYLGLAIGGSFAIFLNGVLFVAMVLIVRYLMGIGRLHVLLEEHVVLQNRQVEQQEAMLDTMRSIQKALESRSPNV